MDLRLRLAVHPDRRGTMGADDEWLAKGPRDYACYEHNPENPTPLPEEAAHPDPPVPTPSGAGSLYSFACERFAGKVAHKGRLVDEAALRECIKTEEKGAVGSKAFASPLSRYWRLKKEISRFQASLSALSEVDARTPKTTKDIDSVGTEFNNAIDAASAWPWLQHHSPGLIGLDVASEGARLIHLAREAAGKGTLTYELTAITAHKNRLAMMGNKMDAMEKVVGTAVPASLNAKALNEGLNSILMQVETLSSTRLALLQRRVKGVTHDLQTREQTGRGGPAPDEQETLETKLKGIEELAGKWMGALGTIDPTIAKLTNKQDQHRRAIACLERLNRLKTKHAFVTRTAGGDTKALAVAVGSVEENMKVMGANVAALQARLQALA